MCVDSGVHYEPEPDDVREVGGWVVCDFGDGVGYGPQFPVGGGPAGDVARVVVHVVVSPVWVSCRVAPPVMGVRADSPEASVKKGTSASAGCGRRHGFMGR